MGAIEEMFFEMKLTKDKMLLRFPINSIYKTTLLFVRDVFLMKKWKAVIVLDWGSVPLYTAWKLSKYGVFSIPYFPVFSPNTVFCIQSEYRKIPTRKTPYLDNFHAVGAPHLFNIVCLIYWKQEKINDWRNKKYNN